MKRLFIGYNDLSVFFWAHALLRAKDCRIAYCDLNDAVVITVFYNALLTLVVLRSIELTLNLLDIDAGASLSAAEYFRDAS